MDTINNNSIRIGYYPSLICLILWLVFTICFIGIFLTNPVFKWTNISDYISYHQTYNQNFKYIAQFSMFLFGPAFMLILISINELIKDERKIYSKISLNFGLVFMTLICLHYFIQITTVPQNIQKNTALGLEHFIQSNLVSFILSLNMLGWTFFLGLSSLFLAPVFSGSRLEKILRYSLIINGMFCLLGGIGYIIQNIALIFLTINFGMGGTIFVITTSLAIFFKRLATK